MTPHFSLKEFVYSETALDRGIDNMPSAEIKKQLHFTAAGMERLRAYIGFPIKITSGYRSLELNKAVGGSEGSQHIKGEACDFRCSAFGTPRQVALYLEPKVKILGIDQLILEHSWIHVSFTLNPRYEVLSLLGNGKYMTGIV